MHCDVDLRSRRMWAASYRLTRLIMDGDSHVPSGPDTARERVVTQRRGNGDDGAAADQRLQTSFVNDVNGVNDYSVVCKLNDRLGTPC